MFNYSSASFSNNGSCTDCSLFAVLEVRLRDLEAAICTLQMVAVASLVDQPLLAVAGQLKAAPLRPPAAPEQRCNQGSLGNSLKEV